MLYTTPYFIYLFMLEKYGSITFWALYKSAWYFSSKGDVGCRKFSRPTRLKPD